MTTVPVQLTPEERVIASIRALKAAQHMSTEELHRRLHISRTTWFDRMKDGQFTIGEIAVLADTFGVSVQNIVDGIGLKGTVAFPRPNLSLVRGAGATTAPRSPLLHTVNPLD